MYWSDAVPRSLSRVYSVVNGRLDVLGEARAKVFFLFFFGFCVFVFVFALGFCFFLRQCFAVS